MGILYIITLIPNILILCLNLDQYLLFLLKLLRLSWCTDIYIYVCINKGTVFRQTYPLFNPGRWDLDAPDPGLWEVLKLVYIYIYVQDLRAAYKNKTQKLRYTKKITLSLYRLQAVVKRCRCLGVLLDEPSIPACHSQKPPQLFGGARLGKFLDRLYFRIIRTDASSPIYISQISCLAAAKLALVYIYC